MKLADKQKTIDAYNSYAQAFSAKFSSPSPTLMAFLDAFLAELKGQSILDIGAGDGTSALYVQGKGCNAVCVDLSTAMVEIMKSRGLDARLMDMQEMGFDEASFDGILALSSLMNLPKSDLPAVLENVARMLKSGGMFASFITKGDSDGMEIDERYPGTERWFAYYSFDELKNLLEPHFEILDMQDAPTPAREWIFTLARKR